MPMSVAGCPAFSDFRCLLSLEFTVDGGTTWTPLNESTKGDLGYASLPLPAGSEINFATWEYAFVNTLNHTDKSGNAVWVSSRRTASGARGYELRCFTYASGTEGNEILTNTSLNPMLRRNLKDYDNAYHTRLTLRLPLTCGCIAR